MNCKTLCVAFMLSLGMTFFAGNSQAEDEYVNFLLEEDEDSKGDAVSRVIKPYFNEKSIIQDVVDFPKFKGFGHLILPISSMSDLSVHLPDVYRIMNVHHNVYASNTIDSLNYLAHEVDLGNKVYYPIYNEGKIREDGSCKDSGLFFLKAKEKAPFAVVVPGGNDYYSSVIHEGLPLAINLHKRGYNVFVLSYRKRSVSVGSDDLATAIDYIMEHAEELNVAVKGYSLWGAGLGCQVVLNVTQNLYHRRDCEYGKSVTNVLEYPIAYHSSQNDVPTVFVVGETDNIVNKTVLKSAVLNLKKMKLSSLYISVPKFGHAFGLGLEKYSISSSDWITQSVEFWNENRVSRINFGN